MPSTSDKVILGAAGAIGAGVLSWKAFFPWIQYDLKFMKAGKRAGQAIMNDNSNGRFLINMFEENVEKFPNKPFVIFEDKIYTYGFMNEQVNRTANIASQWGLKLGECVAIMVENEPAFIWTFLGLQKLGIAVAFINFNIKGKPLVHTLTACEAKYLILGKGDHILQSVHEIVDDLGGMPIYVQGTNLMLADRYQSWDNAMLHTLPVPVCKVARKGMNPSTPCCYIFTSGTTGLPKPAIITQAKAIGISKFFQLFAYNTNDIIYTVTPLYHSAAGGLGLMNTLDQGATMVLRKKFSSHHFFEDVRRHNVTVIQYIGELCRYLLSVKENPLDSVHKVRLAIGAGLRTDIWKEFETRYKIPWIIEYFGTTEGTAAFMNLENKFGACGRLSPFLSPLDGVHKVQVAVGNGLRPDIWDEFKNRFKIPNICEFFGATEGTIATMNLNNRIGACGRFSPILNKLDPTPKLLVKYDLDNETVMRDKNGFCIEVPVGEPGLLLGGVPIYYQDLQFYKGGKAVNEKKVVRDVKQKGDVFFNFGDLLTLDKDYFIYFTDRIGDTFRWKGENVATSEVANVLTQLDFVHDANVYGVAVPGSDGKAGMAAMHLNENQSISAENLSKIYSHCKAYLPSYARPLFLRFPKEEAITVTLKQQKTSLRKEGFDPNVVEDPLFYLDEAKQTYSPMTVDTYPKFLGKARL